MIRLALGLAPEAGGGLLHALQVAQGVAQLVPDLGAIRLQVGCAVETGNRLQRPPLRQQCAAQVVVRLGVGGI